MRQEFEKLPEIARRLYQLEFRPDINTYLAKPEYCNRYVNFVNGAMYAYQEPQRKIDSVLHYLSCASNPLDVEVKDIQELLK